VSHPDVRQEFVQAFLALQQAFSNADRVVAKAYNEAQRAGGNAPLLTKLKAVVTRTEKQIQKYGEEVDDLLWNLDY